MQSIVYFVSPVPPCKAIVCSTEGTLDAAAVQYIRSKNGDERAENAYTKPSDQGYYLVPTSPECLEVREVKKETVDGWFTTGVEQSDTSVGWFHVLEIDLKGSSDSVLPRQPKTTRTTTKMFPPGLLEELQDYIKTHQKKQD